jgi:hypothetical protein
MPENKIKNWQKDKDSTSRMLAICYISLKSQILKQINNFIIHLTTS